MSDRDPKKTTSPAPGSGVVCSTHGDRFTVPDSGDSIRKRVPMEVDGIICACGEQDFFVGVAELGKECASCKSSLVALCLRCHGWSCLGCLERGAIRERERRNVPSLATVGRMLS